MIVTLTLNPSVDRTVEVETLARGEVMRALRRAGRSRRQGHQRLTGPCRPRSADARGRHGRRSRGRAPRHAAAGDGDRDRAGPGPGRDPVQHHRRRARWDDDQVQRARRPAERRASSTRYSTRSRPPSSRPTGSSPAAACRPGRPPSFYADLVRMLAGSGTKVAVDTSGPALEAVLAAGPSLVKPNRDELAEVTGKRLGTIADVVEAAGRLRDRGAGAVLASLGADGAVLVDDDGAIHGQTPAVPPLSSVGAGDAMLAGFLAGGGDGGRRAGRGASRGVLPPCSSRAPACRRRTTSTARRSGSRATASRGRTCSPCRPDIGGGHRGTQSDEAPSRRRERDPMTATADLKHREGPGMQATIQRIGGYLAGMIMPNIARVHRLGPDHRPVHPDRLAAQRAAGRARRADDHRAAAGPDRLHRRTARPRPARRRHRRRRDDGRRGRHRRPDVPRRDDHRAAGRVPPQAARRAHRRARPRRVRDAGRQLQRRHPRASCMADPRLPGDRTDRREPGATGPATASTPSSTTACCRSCRSSSSRPRCCSSTTRSTTACSGRSASPRPLETGKSILFMIETNPGPGLGILLAYLFFGPRSLRPSAPGAIIIHFFGGIHEIYFPYVLMNPRLILAAIVGGACRRGHRGRHRCRASWPRRRPAASSPTWP